MYLKRRNEGLEPLKLERKSGSREHADKDAPLPKLKSMSAR